MPKYITATEAARRLGVTDKTVRTWIKNGTLAAHHVAKNKLAILAADVEALRRKRENYQDETPDISHLVARITDLERKYSELEQKYMELAVSVAEKVDKQALNQPAIVRAAVSRKSPTDESKAVPVYPPDGSILFADFGEKHGVARNTFSHHVKYGIRGDILETFKRPKPGRSEHTEYWLTPEQQTAAFAFWDRHGVRYNKYLDVE